MASKMNSEASLFDELTAQGETLNFENFANRGERGFPQALNPDWITWVTRTSAIIERNFDDDSAPSKVLESAKSTQLIGNGIDKFITAHSRYMHALRLGANALRSDKFAETKIVGPADAKTRTNKVFIVHGHNDKAKQELEIFLREIGLEPIVLHRQVDEGQTIIEKFEKHSDVGYAFVLLTPDDIAYTVSEGAKADAERVKEFRARQNVILEYGYFIGRLGRANVCCLYTGNVTLPSDMQGLIYKRFATDIEEAAYGIIRELKARGYELR